MIRAEMAPFLGEPPMMGPPPPVFPRSPRARGPLPKLTTEAWEAAWYFLEDGPKPRPLILKTMRELSGLSHRSSVELLLQAVELGFLVVKERDDRGRPTLARTQ